MDTLEYRSEISRGEDGKVSGVDVTAAISPILWRGKTARDIYQERYFDKDYTFTKSGTPPKSLSSQAEYCQTYTVEANKGEKVAGNTYASVRLVELPEKK